MGAHPVPSVLSPAVLIAGAGPTGLVLAISLARQGVPFRIVDAMSDAGKQSRAMIVHARTLEFYRQFGFAQSVVDGGTIVERAHLRESRHDQPAAEIAELSFEDMDEGDTPYPFVLAFPQDDHERLLVAELRRLGVEVERDTRVTAIEVAAGGVRATLQKGGPSGPAETVEALWLCGCDGVHSVVREHLGIGFPGGTYDQRFYVADVRIAGDFRRDMVMDLGETALALMFPVRSSGMQRLIGLVPPALAEKHDITFEDLRAEVEPLLDIAVREVNWFSDYRVHHRVAEHFRSGRAFLLGDAAHVHSPAGGQGMNTGIGDAINLGWKLGQVVRGRLPDSVLDSYEAERIAFARKLVHTTDEAFRPMTAQGLAGDLTRRVMAPVLVALVSHVAPLRHAAFRVLSQIGLNYRDGPLSQGRCGAVHAGDRLPWLGKTGADNFTPLTALDWQVHVIGQPPQDLRAVCADAGLPVHAFEDAPPRSGLEHGQACLVRPDGYIGWTAPATDAAGLRDYLARIGLRAAVPTA